MADETLNELEANSKSNLANVDPEIEAIGLVYAALKGLDGEAQTRVLEFVTAKLQVKLKKTTTVGRLTAEETVVPQTKEHKQPDAENEDLDDTDDNDGISSVAKKWMKRSGLNAEKLSAIFSLGIDDIDLVAQSVPGKGKKDRMHNIFLLEGVAAYLGTGSPRFTFDKLKDALTHYDAFDSSNFAAFYKTFSSEVSGSKETGYQLTARGLTNATTLLKEMS